MLDPNFRLEAFHEARKCLRVNSEHDVNDAEFWANLLGAVANAAIASVPDSVATALVQESVRHRAVRKHLKERLDG